jgi:murein DD-endopeptidase MepM/ murein hydrolase activator NlpD
MPMHKAMDAVRRRVALVALLGACGLVAGVVSGLTPASAQAPSSTTSTTSGTSSTTTNPLSTSTSVTLLPGSTTTSTTLPGGSSTTSSSIVDPVGDGDAPADTVPVVDDTVPPRDPIADGGGAGPGSRYSGQVALEQAPGRLVTVDVRTARSAALEKTAALEAATAARIALEQRLADLEDNVESLDTRNRLAIRDLAEARTQLSERAADAYVRGTLVDGAVLGGDEADHLSRVELLDAVLEADQAAVDEFTAARRKVSVDQADTADELVAVRRQLEQAKMAEDQAKWEAASAQYEFEVFTAGGQFAIHGFAFPVGDPHSYGDSYGAPRMMGTQYQHWHEGTDILAPFGTPLYACERGVITKLGTDVLGGIKLWLKGESGTYYYYAHLQSYAPNVNVGTVVEVGTVVGFVGDTGNARGGPPHLHFEVHPNGGEAINPYPLLKVAEAQLQTPAV